MRLSTLFAAVLAAAPAVVRAIPAPAIEGDEGHVEILETIVYKRDAVLTPRDLELAKRQGVDVTKMFKHSLVRRSDGDDITIWVHNSLQERDEEPDAARASAPEDTVKRALSAPKIRWDQGYDNCYSDSWDGLRTSTSSPTTGGVHEMGHWANTRRGAFLLEDNKRNIWQNLVIAGSNGGANARFSAHTIHNLDWAFIGTEDIRDLVRGALDRYQRNINGKWYVESKGETWCRGRLSPIWNQYHQIFWSLDRYIANVPAG